MDYDDIAPMMGRLWSPLAAVTSRWQGRDNVQIAVAIAAASIVPDRPRVTLQLYKTNLSHDMVLAAGAFALNLLRPEQLDLIGDFGLVSGRDRDKLADVDRTTGATGSPILNDCFGYLDCRVINAMDGGDMTCFLAEVLDGKTLSQDGPLWWRDARRCLPTEWLARWEQVISPPSMALIGDFGLVSGRDRDKLADVDRTTGATGSPILNDCFGYLDCRVINAMDGGDMTCFLAEVLDGKTLSQDGPLWWRDARRCLPTEWLARWEQKQSSEIATSRSTMDNVSPAPWQPPR